MPTPTPPSRAEPSTDHAGPPQPGLDARCAEALERLAGQQLRRGLRPAQPTGRHIDLGARQLLNLAGNDYLGLSHHPALIRAATEATQQFGVGSGASRLVCGTTPLHAQVEQRFAAFKHAGAALLLPTGYMANLAVLTALAGPGDLVVLDKLVHASLIDAARASGAAVRAYPHLRLDRAEHLLQKPTAGRRLLVTDSVFSMDGDCADLPGLCDLADRFDAVLVIDEAHGTGVLGDDGSGLAAAQGVAERVYTCGTGGVVVSTASKALGSLGGLITASPPVIDLIVNQARPFIYTTAVPPAQAAAIDAAIDVIRNEPEARKRLTDLSHRARIRLAEKGWLINAPADPSRCTPILPLVVGDTAAALALAQHLQTRGVFAPAIRPPTVAPGTSRVRLSLRADLTDADLDHVIDAIGGPPR